MQDDDSGAGLGVVGEAARSSTEEKRVIYKKTSIPVKRRICDTCRLLQSFSNSEKLGIYVLRIALILPIWISGAESLWIS